MKTLRPSIERAGQRYVDKPVYTYPEIDVLGMAVNAAFNKCSPLPPPILTGHERVRLRWMKPDGKGGLVPRTKRARRVR